MIKYQTLILLGLDAGAVGLLLQEILSGAQQFLWDNGRKAILRRTSLRTHS